MNKTLVVALVGCLLFSGRAFGKYARPQLKETPIDRLVENLNAQLAENPKDVTTRFNLARLHAMAYALKTDVVEVASGQPNEAWLGYEPRHVPFRLENTEDDAKTQAGLDHLELAIREYQEVIRLKPDHLSAQLGYGWCLDQAGKKKAAIAQYRKTISQGWAKEKEMTRAGLGWHSVVEEAAGYLKPHLDATADRDEIRQLDLRIRQVSRILRPVTPIAIPLRDGLNLQQIHNRQANVTFDADGSGQARGWSWISANAGWLVYDAGNSGKITSALQLFGNVSFWLSFDNGYQALQSLDDDRNGVLTGDELKGLAIWHDVNSNGVSDLGEVQSLAKWNITVLSCHYEVGDDADRTARSPRGVVFADGTTRATYDVILQPWSKRPRFTFDVGNPAVSEVANKSVQSFNAGR